MRVIFLDIDGVLNSQRYFESGAIDPSGLSWGKSQIDPEAVSRLNTLVAETGAKIVISSSWRHMWSLGEMKKMLGERGFEHVDDIIDITPTLDGVRGDEILDWLENQEEGSRIGGESVGDFVIIDDDSDFPHPGQSEKLVQTNHEVGLTDLDVRRAISVLGY